jgi:hypothetical protein
VPPCFFRSSNRFRSEEAERRDDGSRRLEVYSGDALRTTAAASLRTMAARAEVDSSRGLRSPGGAALDYGVTGLG